MAAALLRFNFNYGDLIRWLKGPYTYSHRDWSTLQDCIKVIEKIPPPPGWPRVNLPRAMKVLQQGCPLAGHYHCSFDSVLQRNLHPLSKDLQKEAKSVDERLRKEEKLSYHILLPRFLFRFLFGLHLALFQVAYKNNDPDPRLCVNPTSTVSKTDNGNANAQIPDPGAPGRHEENPPIYYGTAFIRQMVWLWNLRISYPHEDILQLADDVSAAFHRILYDPLMALVFATVWGMYLVIPVGTIFGARNSPSFYMEAGETRSHLAGSWPDATSLPLQDLAEQVVLPPSPTPAEAAAFAQAVADSQHQGIANPHSSNPERRLPSFVDDSCTAHVAWYFRTAINVVVWAARVVFGFPQEDPTRPPCINPFKWIKDAAARVKFLGFLLDTRQMLVIWPLDKRAKLSALILELLSQQSPPHRRGSTPQSIAKILGLLRHGAMVAPLGALQTLRLQFFLNDIVSKAPAHLRRWWQGIRLVLPRPIVNDLRRLQSTLLSDESDPRRSRLIGLIIPRDPTHISRSDASMNGMGAWSANLPHMWRLSIADLKACAIPTHGRHNQQYHEPKAEQAPAHINILEFFWHFHRTLASHPFPQSRLRDRSHQRAPWRIPHPSPR